MEKPGFPDKWEWHGCDAVEFDPLKMSGRATVVPVRFEADDVLEHIHSGYSVDELLNDYDLDRDAVEKILAFAAAKGFKPIEQD